MSGAGSGPRAEAGPAGTPLLIVGAGGFARETAQAVRDVLAADRAAGRPERWRLLGHLDDNPALRGSEVDGVPVLGGCDLARELPDAQVLVCVGSPADYAVRARLVRRLDLPERRYATLVHPTAVVSDSSSVGPGSVLLAHCVLTAAVRVGAHVAVMPQVVLTHDDDVADFVTLAAGVRLGGGTRLERGAYIGSGALIRQHTVIGAWSLVGLGSAVLGDVPPGEVWVGSPARRLRAAGPEALRESRTAPADTTGAGRRSRRPEAGAGAGAGEGQRPAPDHGRADEAAGAGARRALGRGAETPATTPTPAPSRAPAPAPAPSREPADHAHQAHHADHAASIRPIGPAITTGPQPATGMRTRPL